MKELYSRETREDLAESQANELRKIIVENWDKGVQIYFLKKDGSERKMLVWLDEETLAPAAEEDPRTAQRRITNKERQNQVVTEYLPDEDEFQIRTVPLRKIFRIELP